MGVRKTAPTTFAGIDVGGKELVVALVRRGGDIHHLTIANTPEGHRILVRALKKQVGTTRVALEATGSFHLDLALLLSRTPGIELMVVNPLAARRFAQAQMRRAKTDKVDAGVLLEFCRRMEWEAWSPPPKAALELRTITRHLSGLIAEQTALKNRIAAGEATETTPKFVRDDLAEQLAAVGARIAKCEAEAIRVACTNDQLKASFTALDTMPGVGPRSAVLLLGELGVLDQAMTPDEIVGHAGLDPRPIQSGMRGRNEVGRRISKVGNARVRAALYMVAVSASSRTPGPVQDFYERLRARDKAPYVALTAVMRRLLRVAWVLQKAKTSWEPSLFAPRPLKLTDRSVCEAAN